MNIEIETFYYFIPILSKYLIIWGVFFFNVKTGDGFMDAVICLFGGGEVQWYSNNGTGSFTLEQTLTGIGQTN